MPVYGTVISRTLSITTNGRDVDNSKTFARDNDAFGRPLLSGHESSVRSSVAADKFAIRKQD